MNASTPMMRVDFMLKCDVELTVEYVPHRPEARLSAEVTEGVQITLTARDGSARKWSPIKLPIPEFIVALRIAQQSLVGAQVTAGEFYADDHRRAVATGMILHVLKNGVQFRDQIVLTSAEVSRLIMVVEHIDTMVQLAERDEIRRASRETENATLRAARTAVYMKEAEREDQLHALEHNRRMRRIEEG